MNKTPTFAVVMFSAFLATPIPASAAAVYWNLFNFEEEDQLDAIYATYGSLLDMLTDSNRTGTFVPDVTGLSAPNVVGSGSDGSSFWNIFNFEEEDELDGLYVTYDSALDMLTDSSRTGTFVPDTTGLSAPNVVGSGSDGSTYWTLFNFEEEDELDAIYATYDSLSDMVTDSNRTGTFVPDVVGLSARNVVGSGSDGSTYWNLFNFEEEDQLDAVYATYGSLFDMLTDSNRKGTFVPDTTGLSAANVVGSGAYAVPDPAPIPLPASGVLLGSALGAGALARRKSTRS